MFVLINPKFMEPRFLAGRMNPDQFDDDTALSAQVGKKGVVVPDGGAAATTTSLTVVGAVLALVVLVGGKTKGNVKGKGKKGDKKKKKGEKVSIKSVKM